MSDYIDRQDAIDAHCELCGDRGKCSDICPDVEVFKLLPSVQPETEERTAESAQNVPKGELISKKAAIEAVLDRCPSDYDSEYECGYYDALKEAVPMLIHVPSVQPQRWIPVTEKLPDRYIVGCDGKHYSQDVLMTVIHRDDDIFIDYGQMVDYEWYSEMDKEIITSPFEVVAWMPLPPVYEGGQDEDDRC